MEQNVENAEITAKLKVIKPGSVINVSIPVDIYYRLNQFILYGFPFKNNDTFSSTLEKIQKGEEDTPEAYHFKTLLGVQSLIENAAKEQNLTGEYTQEEIEKMFNLSSEDQK